MRLSFTMDGPGAVMDSMAVWFSTAADVALSDSMLHSGMNHPDGSPPASLRAEASICRRDCQEPSRLRLTLLIDRRVYVMVDVDFGHI